MNRAILANGTVTVEGARPPREDASDNTSKPAASSRRLSRWLLAIPALLLGFAVLAYAEVVWLHNLPHDSATRIALVAFPDPRAGAMTGPDWNGRLLRTATDADLMQSLIARLDLRDPATGQEMSAQSLAANMRLGSECIELNAGQPNAVRGLLLYNVVRGADSKVTDSVAGEWAKFFTQRSATELPGLIVQPLDSLGVPYEICR